MLMLLLLMILRTNLFVVTFSALGTANRLSCAIGHAIRIKESLDITTALHAIGGERVRTRWVATGEKARRSCVGDCV